MERYHEKLKDSRDRALFVEIVHGVFRFRNLLDYYINYVAPKGVKDDRILTILRIATYELIFLGKIPEYATIFEAGELTEKINRDLKGFVNAVLRNILRKKDQIESSLEKIKDINLKNYISIKLSYPFFLIDYLEKSYGFEKTISILEFLNSRPMISAKINTKKIDPNHLLNMLNEKGYDFQISELNNEVFNLKKGNLKESEFYLKGYVYFQDAASSMVVKLNQEDFIKAKQILDICASPGGKTFNAAEVTQGEIISCDISQSKIDVLKRNINRLGYENVRLIKNDALTLNPDFIERFDIVIADLPCSGLGTIRKKPEIKWNKTACDIENLHTLQLNILDNVAMYVKKNGKILYSTCTLGYRENQDTVKEFLEKHTNYSLVYQKTIFPDEFNCDGFFIAKLKREE